MRNTLWVPSRREDQSFVDFATVTSALNKIIRAMLSGSLDLSTKLVASYL